MLLIVGLSMTFVGVKTTNQEVKKIGLIVTLVSLGLLIVGPALSIEVFPK